MKAKKGEDEGGEKKAIMGILLAVIMVSSVIVVIVQMGSARDAGGVIEVGDIVYSGEHGAVKEVVYKGEDIILTVTGYPNYYYYFAVENVTAGEEPYIKDTADIVSLGQGKGVRVQLLRHG